MYARPGMLGVAPAIRPCDEEAETGFAARKSLAWRLVAALLPAAWLALAPAALAQPAPPAPPAPPAAPPPAAPAPPAAAPPAPPSAPPPAGGDAAPAPGTADAPAPPAGDAPLPPKKPKTPGYAEVPKAPPRAYGPADSTLVQAERKNADLDDRRTPPDYDNRDEVTTAGDAALWVPRVAFYPAYLVTEYLVRAPLGALTVAVESNDVIGTLEDIFTFGPDNNIAIVPTGFVDFGFRPSIGVFFSYDDFLAKGNDLVATVSTGGERYYRGAAADRISMGDQSFLQLEIDAIERPDLLYWGIGPRTLDSAEASYDLRTIGGGVRVHVDLVKSGIGKKGNFFEGWLLTRGADFGNGDCAGAVDRQSGAFSCSDATILEQVRRGRYDLPPGFEGYAVVKTGGRLVLDSRDPRPAPGTGVALDLQGEHVGDVMGPETSGWVNYGATAAAFVDLTGTQRVLSLSVGARFADALRDGYAIPFTELVGNRRFDDIPDSELLHGFRPGRLLGESAAVAALEYRWPVWTFLDGVMQGGVANTFGPHLEDFDPELLRFAFSGGLRSSNHRDHSFNFLLGFGTETFEQGAALTSVRFLFGGTTGF
jgi:hypothetical protein